MTKTCIRKISLELDCMSLAFLRARGVDGQGETAGGGVAHPFAENAKGWGTRIFLAQSRAGLSFRSRQELPAVRAPYPVWAGSAGPESLRPCGSRWCRAPGSASYAGRRR